VFARRQNWLAAVLVAAGLFLVIYGLVGSPSPFNGTLVSDRPATAVPTTAPTRTPEPIIPTRTPTTAATETAVAINADAATSATPTVSLTATAVASPSPPASATATSLPAVATTAATGTAAPSTTDLLPAAIATHPAPMPASLRARFGVAAAARDVGPALNQGLNFGSYLNWKLHANPPRPQGVQFWQMIRLSEAGYRPDRVTIAQVIDSQPGSFWVIGNEPDVPWQDNVTPQRYAEIYHELYHFIKERDPSALLVIGGVTQPSPLRLAYLDTILDSYQARYGTKMPIDVWNVHAFVLHEERDSWGVGIPPGMGDDLATPYEIGDHDNLAIFRQNLINFRAWMAARGYRDRPLVVTEYGILLPNDYGFPPEAIASFMTSSFDFFLTAANDTGYPPDNNRLVQWWFWFSLYDYPDYPTSNLYDRPSGQLTLIGQAFRDYVNARLGN
jgi:hypothetical protein